MYALYARQSKDKKDSISIESQFEFCMREVPLKAQVKKYEDRGFSGKNTVRPGFQKMMEDIRNGLIKKVVVYRLDRMSRSILDFARIVEEFNKYDVEFISTTEKFDTATPMGKAMLSIVMVFAQLERETIQQRITDNYYERGKKGMFLGGNVPFGFKLKLTKIDGIKTNKLIPNENIQHVIEMYRKYACSKASLGEITSDLNARGITTIFNNSWDSGKISRLLRNPVYVRADIHVYNYYKNKGCIIHNDIEEFDGTKGIYLYGKNASNSYKYLDLEGYHVVLAPHEGVIDSDIFLNCQRKLDNNKQIKNTGKSKHTWLSGLVKCKKCGYAMTVNQASLSPKNNTYTIYLRCSGRAIRRVCDANSVRVKIVEDYVKNKIFNHIKDFNNKLKEEHSQDNKKTKELQTLIIAKETEIENLIDNLAKAKGAAMKYINQRIETLDNELIELRERLINMQAKSLNTETVVDLNRVIELWDEFDLEDKKEICNELIDKILLEKTGDSLDDIDVEIVWND